MVLATRPGTGAGERFKRVRAFIQLMAVGGALLAVAMTGPLAGAAAEEAFVVTTDFRYVCPGEAGGPKSKALAMFTDRHQAVQLAAKYLTHKGLLEHFQNKQGEIFCLAADEIETTVIEENFDRARGSYYVRIRAEINSLDFIQAQIKDLNLEKEEAAFSFSQEMEQPVLAVIDPGRELSRAYRYIRKKQWRIAMIYLGHLQKKYRCWGDLYLAKAIAAYGMNASAQMVEALDRACALGNQEACRERRGLSAHEF